MCIVYWKDELLDETLLNELLNLDGKEPSLVEEKWKYRMEKIQIKVKYYDTLEIIKLDVTRVSISIGVCILQSRLSMPFIMYISLLPYKLVA